MEAETNINFNCGCGFQTKDEEKAKKHSQTTGHSLTALGSVSEPSRRQLVLQGEQLVKARVAREADEARARELAKLKARIALEAEEAKAKAVAR